MSQKNSVCLTHVLLKQLLLCFTQSKCCGRESELADAEQIPTHGKNEGVIALIFLCYRQIYQVVIRQNFPVLKPGITNNPSAIVLV